MLNFQPQNNYQYTQSDEAFKGKLKPNLQNILPKKLIFVFKVTILGLIAINKEIIHITEGLSTYTEGQLWYTAFNKRCLPSIFLIFLSVLSVKSLLTRYWWTTNIYLTPIYSLSREKNENHRMIHNPFCVTMTFPVRYGLSIGF